MADLWENIGNWWANVNKPVNLTPVKPGAKINDWHTAGQLQSAPTNYLGGTLGGGAITQKPKVTPRGMSSTLEEYKAQLGTQNNAGTQGMTPEQLLAFILGGGGGGGGVDLSGYNTLLSDIAAREKGTGKRYKQNKADIAALYAGSKASREKDLAGLADLVAADVAAAQTQQTNRAAETRAAEAARLAVTNQARGALGATTPTADLATAATEGGISRLAEQALAAQSDIRTGSDIYKQQLQGELSGYTSAEALANRALSQSYEDALAGLASERANIKAQIAGAKASARGSSGPSVSEKIKALEFIQGGNGSTSKFSGDSPSSVINYYVGQTGQTAKYNNIANVITQNLGLYGTDKTTGKLMDPVSLYNQIASKNSAVTQDPNYAIDLIKSLIG